MRTCFKCNKVEIENKYSLCLKCFYETPINEKVDKCDLCNNDKNICYRHCNNCRCGIMYVEDWIKANRIKVSKNPKCEKCFDMGIKWLHLGSGAVICECLKIDNTIKPDEKKYNCKCGIDNICKCSNPNIEYIKINNAKWCNGCNKWLCRC